MLEKVLVVPQYAGFEFPSGASDEVPETEPADDSLEKFLADQSLHAIGISAESFHRQTAQLNERVAAVYKKIAAQAGKKTAPAEIPLAKRAAGVARVVKTTFPLSGKVVIAELDEHGAVIRTYLEN